MATATVATMTMTIGELARRAGARPSAIRYYESVGVLPEPARVNGRRRYGAETLAALRAIGVARAAGASVADLRELFAGVRERQAPSDVWARFAERKLREIDDGIARAHEMKRLLEHGLRCGCLTVDACVLFTGAAGGESVGAQGG